VTSDQQDLPRREGSCSPLFTRHLSLLLCPSRAIPPIGNWTCGRFSKPQILTLPRRSLTQILSLSPQGGLLKRLRGVTREAGRAMAGFSISSPAGGLPRFAFFGHTPAQRPCVFNKFTVSFCKPHHSAPWAHDRPVPIYRDAPLRPAMVVRERVFRHVCGATNAPPRVSDCQFALGFGSAKLRKDCPDAPGRYACYRVGPRARL
jgi:hypothetical protein